MKLKITYEITYQGISARVAYPVSIRPWLKAGDRPNRAVLKTLSINISNLSSIILNKYGQERVHVITYSSTFFR